MATARTPAEIVTSVADLLRARASDERPGLRFADETWSWRQVVHESAVRAQVAVALREPGPFHIGVLLENVPEYVFWLGGAALAGATIVGINSTRRGAELARDVAHTDCQLIVTDTAGLALLDLEQEAPLASLAKRGRILVVDRPEYAEVLARHAGAPLSAERVEPSSLFLLLFTSGSTGAPKAVRCSQRRMLGGANGMVELFGLTAEDVCYGAMPLFHGNTVITCWAPTLLTGACFATRRRFSASGFLPDVRKFGVTYGNYVGKALAYVLATPERPDDADNPLRRLFGTEASQQDIRGFERRFGCKITERYGSSEGAARVRWVEGMPEGALGVGDEHTVVMKPETLEECPRARFDATGRLLNAEQAIGQIVNRAGVALFEGYYKNEAAEAQRTRNGWFWMDDLAYRDQDGFFYFAGRSSDWLRVDAENFATAPVERVLSRFPGVLTAAVYAVPDVRSGDQVMVALELQPGLSFDPGAFASFLGEQADLGTKWAPRYVRIVSGMPLTASSKVIKKPLQGERWECADRVYWRAVRGDPTYRRMTDEDVAALRKEFADNGRESVLALG